MVLSCARSEIACVRVYWPCCPCPRGSGRLSPLCARSLSGLGGAGRSRRPDPAAAPGRAVCRGRTRRPRRRRSAPGRRESCLAERLVDGSCLIGRERVRVILGEDGLHLLFLRIREGLRIPRPVPATRCPGHLRAGAGRCPSCGGFASCAVSRQVEAPSANVRRMTFVFIICFVLLCLLSCENLTPRQINAP